MFCIVLQMLMNYLLLPMPGIPDVLLVTLIGSSIGGGVWTILLPTGIVCVILLLIPLVKIDTWPLEIGPV